MLLAKLALVLGGTMLLAGVYTFHEGILQVQVDEWRANGKHIHVWLPAVAVPVAMNFVPRQKLERAVEQAGPWMPTVRALTKELAKYRDAQLVEVRGWEQHVSVRMHDGKVLVDVSVPGEEVHVACPLAMIEHVSRELEANEPTL
jgi:hypothetical protein